MSSNQHSLFFEYLFIHLNTLVSKRSELSSTIHAIRRYVEFGLARSFSNGLQLWVIISLALSLPLLATYIVSMYRFGAATRSTKFGKVVPAIPYLIPAIGHIFSFAWDTTESLSQAMCVFFLLQNQSPAKLRFKRKSYLLLFTENSLGVAFLYVSSLASRTLSFSQGQTTSSYSGSYPRN